MNIVFLMEPLESVKTFQDTTFILMVEAHRRKYNVFHLPVGGLSIHNGKILFDVIEVIPQFNSETAFKIIKTCQLVQNEVDAIFIRPDPPFDNTYLMQTWILDQVVDAIPIINSPSGVRTVNEKVWATQFTALTPKTIVTRQKAHCLDFLESEKEIILKPTNSFGGRSIFHIRKDDTNRAVIIETVTENETKEVICQRYIPEADRGDKRILLLEGDPLGAALRVHKDGEHRNNICAGGSVQATKITKRDLEIIDTLKPHLKKLELDFVGIDILGDYLIEVNVTSPTCLQDMNRLYNKRLEEKVIDCMEARITTAKLEQK